MPWSWASWMLPRSTEPQGGKFLCFAPVPEEEDDDDGDEDHNSDKDAKKSTVFLLFCSVCLCSFRDGLTVVFHSFVFY